ncbi:MAG: glycosyltransferase family 1 protein [Caldilineae bacterium]|nr:MAG: glycosyltransferase family 1 protein [Caldilineae bacterium]
MVVSAADAGSAQAPHLVINGWFWGRADTGSGQYLYGLLRHLPRALPGWRLTLVLPPAADAEPEPDLPPGVEGVRTGLPVYARGARLIKLAWEQQIFSQMCARLSADVAFVPYWGSPLRSPCPTVVTIHDLIPLLLEDYATKPTARAYTWLVSRSARRAAAILAVSRSARDDIVRHLAIPPERVHITYEGLGWPHAPVEDEVERETLRRKYALPRRYLFYLGGFDPRKNVPLLLQSYGRARELAPDLPPLVVAGRLPAAGQDWFTDPRPLLRELGLEGSVRLLGFVPNADKPGLYSMADLFIFPSRYEGFGLPVLEAMACGTPALVSDSSSLPEVVGHTLRPVPVNDVEALAQGILAALADPPPPQTLLAQAARFDWESAAHRTATAIQSVYRTVPPTFKRPSHARTP